MQLDTKRTKQELSDHLNQKTQRSAAGWFVLHQCVSQSASIFCPKAGTQDVRWELQHGGKWNMKCGTSQHICGATPIERSSQHLSSNTSEMSAAYRTSVSPVKSSGNFKFSTVSVELKTRECLQLNCSALISFATGLLNTEWRFLTVWTLQTNIN